MSIWNAVPYERRDNLYATNKHRLKSPVLMNTWFLKHIFSTQFPHYEKFNW
jgi:hypothetical protein